MITWRIDYRMPPLHAYPAALDDCLAVYRAVLELRDPFVGGASAGGNLAAAMMVRARDEGLPMPAALVLPTPAVDLTESGDTFQTLDGVDGGLRSQMAVNLLYANGHDLTDPYLRHSSPTCPTSRPPSCSPAPETCCCPTRSGCTASCWPPGSTPSCTSSKPCRTGASAAARRRTLSSTQPSAHS
jgi:acetyl esterase/lipase